MPQPERLRVADVRNVIRLIGECRELGADPMAWRQHYVHGLRRLVGAQAAVGGGWQITRPDRPPLMRDNFVLGFENERRRDAWLAFSRERMTTARSFQRFATSPGMLITCTRREVASDREWYRSPEYQDDLREAGVDATVASFYRPQPWNICSAVVLHRPTGERQFIERERRLLDLAQSEIGPLIGVALVGTGGPSVAQLPLRAQQTLGCLIEGYGEKQTAQRLGISPGTVHQYVKRIYRHYGVRSRLELLAWWLRFYRGSARK